VKILKRFQDHFAGQGASIGFVPTMGALHAGHRSLVEASKRENDKTVVSLFVNPVQFNNPDDFKNYPRTEAEDLCLLEEWGVDFVFIPRAEDMYADGYKFQVTETEDSKVLCGAHRPGHFDGVLTVVLKLFNMVRPTRAYFGEKDFQQLRLIAGMVEALHVPVAIVPCPTVREADGLAMSSRNVRLSPAEREQAAVLPKVLRSAVNAAAAAAELAALGFKIDYVEDRWNRRLAAVHLGNVRLIDNVEL
jgi:pantoate--beta-alanine ligase